MLRYLLFGILIVFSFGSFAQESQFSPRIEFFSIPNSAINSEEISDIKIDSEGYVWIVSFKGLYRFDGKNFQKISANLNSFGSLIRFYEGNQKEKFVIDYWGAIYFVDNDSLYEYKYNSELRSQYKGYGYSDIALIDGQLHFAYNSSSYKVLDSGKVIDPLATKKINFNGYACQLKEERVEPFIFKGNSLKKEEKKWFFLFDSLMQKIDSVALTFNKTKNPPAICRLGNGNYLLSTGKGNLISFDENGVVFSKNYPEQIINLFSDKLGNLWLSTRGAGIHYYSNGAISEENKVVLLPRTTTVVTAQDYQNGIWLYSQDKGVGYISHPEIKFLKQQNTVRPLVETLENTKEGVVYSDGNQLKLINHQQEIENWSDFESDHEIMRLSYDKSRDRLWVSSRGGLAYIQEDKALELKGIKERFRGSFSYLSSAWEDSTLSLIGTNGYQYFICNDSAISYESKTYNHKLKGIIQFNDSIIVNTGNGLYLETEEKNIYLGEQNDLAKKSLDQLIIFNNKRFISVPSEGVYMMSGLNFNSVNYNGEPIPSSHLVKQNDTLMWAISNYGIYLIKAIESSFEVTAFNGLPRMVLKKAVFNNGNLLLQSRNNGIGILELEHLQLQKLFTPKLLITKIQSGNKFYYEGENIEPIEYDENSLQLSFKSLNFHDLDVEYRYKLNDESWNYSTIGFVNYVSLSANKYQFEAQSRFGLGDWSESKAIEFKVVPPFWQRWWFLTASLFLILFISYQVLNARFKRINKEKSLTIGRLTAEQKALRAKMDPHFMFNVISSVQYLILRKENKKATLFLNKFSTLLRSTLNQTDDDLISLESEIKFLTEYIELEKMRLEDKFEYKFEIDPVVDLANKIPTFIVQPLVENAIHHGLKAKSDQGLLQLKFSLEKGLLKIVVEDNGQGYKKSLSQKKDRLKHVSHGIQTIKDRLKMYQSKNETEVIFVEDLSDENKNNSGTRVIIKLNLKKI